MDIVFHLKNKAKWIAVYILITRVVTFLIETKTIKPNIENPLIILITLCL